MMLRVFGSVGAAVVVIAGFVVAGQDQQAESNGPLETTSLLARKLYALPGDASIEAAQQKLAADPKNVDLVVQLSKAQAGRRRYREAVATCTSGLSFAPESAELYLERGHRELGLREFREALKDLQRAVELNPKQLEEYYHLGLAHYFLREFGPAAESFHKALDLAENSDSVIDCSNWLYVSLRRSGQKDAAAAVLTRITPDTKNTEPHLLFYLRLLRFYQGSIPESQILPPKPANAGDVESELAFDTIGYGVGNWHLYNGDQQRAYGLFKQVVSGDAWNSWGFIGSEVDLTQGRRLMIRSGE